MTVELWGSPIWSCSMPPCRDDAQANPNPNPNPNLSPNLSPNPHPHPHPNPNPNPNPNPKPKPSQVTTLEQKRQLCAASAAWNAKEPTCKTL